MTPFQSPDLVAAESNDWTDGVLIIKDEPLDDYVGNVSLVRFGAILLFTSWPWTCLLCSTVFEKGRRKISYSGKELCSKV
jgi:hypothetical protein